MINDGVVYGLYDYQSDSMRNDELQFKDGDRLIVLRREDEIECEWYWARHDENQQEGYIPRNYLGVSCSDRFSLNLLGELNKRKNKSFFFT